MTGNVRAQASRGWRARLVGGLPQNVVALGITSFFADVSSEMIYPLIPIFLTTTLGAPVTIVGVIEGLAESTASLLKLASGWFSDHIGRRMPLVVGGYGLAAIGKLLLAFAVAWPIVLVARFIDRFGKGVRGSPRDALIADSTPDHMRGRAFGLHRAMDTAGAVIGPLLALALVALFDERFRLIFLLAVIPGVLSVLSLGLVRETPPEARATARGETLTLGATLRHMDRRLLWFVAASLVFALGNSSDIFLILRAKDLGMSTTATVLAYVAYNFVYMLAAVPAGIASDRLGRRGVLVLGLLVFAVVYAGFAVNTSTLLVWPLFAMYGVYIAATDGVSKALITDLAPREYRASVLGFYGMLTGLLVFVASALAGVLWDQVGAWAPFALGASAAVIAAAMLLVQPAQPAQAAPRTAAA
ncbi:MAG: MFS transporter [Dehalococcoidia bacterium]|nr:MFS transporter [Dehalococcoidia bacterium]